MTLSRQNDAFSQSQTASAVALTRCYPATLANQSECTIISLESLPRLYVVMFRNPCITVDYA